MTKKNFAKVKAPAWLDIGGVVTGVEGIKVNPSRPIMIVKGWEGEGEDGVGMALLVVTMGMTIPNSNTMQILLSPKIKKIIATFVDRTQDLQIYDWYTSV